MLAERAEALRPDLEETFGYAAFILPVSPVFATVCVNRGPQYADHIIKLASKDLRVLRALERMQKGSVYASLAMMGGTLLAAIAVDRGMANPHGILATPIQEEVRQVEAMVAEFERRHQAEQNGHNAA